MCKSFEVLSRALMGSVPEGPRARKGLDVRPDLRRFCCLCLAENTYAAARLRAAA